MLRHFLGFAVLMATMVTSALATPKDYCEAYALDFADKVAKEDAAWAVRHGNALVACLFQFQAPASVEAPSQTRTKSKVASKPAEAPSKSKPAAKSKVAVAEEPVEQEPLPEPAVIVVPDIEPPPKKVVATAKQKEPGKAKTLMAKLFPGKSKPVEKGKLAAGSTAWLDYCENKYASFNRETGTYTSFKGVERKCRVTD